MITKILKNLIVINILLYSFSWSEISLAKNIPQQKINNSNLILQNHKVNPLINEIFPNPKGKDSGKEWIELYNPGNQNISLSNWKIRQIKLNFPKAKTKTTLLPNDLIIKSKSYLILDNSHFKSLPNKQTRIELLNSDGIIIDSISYEKNKENLSLSKTLMINTENKKNYQKYLWTIPGKNLPNPIFYQIQGIIKRIENNHFILEKESDTKKHLKIFFEKSNPVNQPKHPLLKENQQILILVENSNNSLVLKNYKIKNKKKLKQENEIKKIDQILIKSFKITLWTTLISIIALIIIKHSTSKKPGNIDAIS